MTISDSLLKSMESTLFAGSYSLLLGAGVSRDARGPKGQLPTGEDLRQELVKLKELKTTSSLSRAYGALTPSEVDTNITDRFIDCKAGPTLLELPLFNWRRIYTFNIDDALENAYEVNRGHQAPIPLTHKSDYKDAFDIDAIQIVHTHGWARNSQDGYIFSLAEYAGSMGPSNPWTNILAHTIASEPFIIAGTGLEEPDLEYFLHGRKAEGVRTDRGPSFLIEPSPDAATEKDCRRHGLNLYVGTFEGFLAELLAAFPSRPLPANATVDLSRTMFSPVPTSRQLAIFSRDFEYTVARQGKENADLGFLVGRKATSNDIALNRDISRKSTLILKDKIKERINSSAPNFLIVSDNAGTGKTTILKRIAYDLAAEGYHVFEYICLSSPNIEIATSSLSSFKEKLVLICDNFADHASAFYEIARRLSTRQLLIVGVERAYRSQHIVQILASSSFETYMLVPFSTEEARTLILRLDQFGLTGTNDLVKHAIDIAKDPIAVATCRAMNDYKPLESIVKSIIADSDDGRIERYSACALAAYCYRGGISATILSAAFDDSGLRQQYRTHDSLPLTFSDVNREYVIPTNPTLGERVLRYVAVNRSDLLFDVYCGVGSYLASYVNRATIRKRTPEARLAQRLFDYDGAVLARISHKFWVHRGPESAKVVLRERLS